MPTNPIEFKTTQNFNAPRELVWQAWTVPGMFGKWFGPKGYSARVETHELRAGGVLHSCLVSPDGHEMWAKFVYREVTPPSRLVWEHAFSDPDGNLTRHPMNPDWPLKLLTTVELEELDGQTQLTLTWTPLEASELECQVFAAEMAGMEQGWGGTWEQLRTFLAEEQSPCTVRVARQFKTAPEAVFDAWLNPEKAGKFLFATPTGAMKKVEIDARVGGKFCIVETRDGVDAEHIGEYLEIARPRSLRFSFGGHPFPATYVTVTIDKMDDGCTLTLVHEGVWRSYEQRVIEGWTSILAGLEKTL